MPRWSGNGQDLIAPHADGRLNDLSHPEHPARVGAVGELSADELAQPWHPSRLATQSHRDPAGAAGT
jgi:hypothetical protein